MPTLVLRVEEFTCVERSNFIASDWKSGQSERRCRGYAPRWKRTWTVRGFMTTRGEVANLLQQMRAGGLGAGDDDPSDPWVWTPPREVTPVEVMFMPTLSCLLRGAVSNEVELVIEEC